MYFPPEPCVALYHSTEIKYKALSNAVQNY